MYMCAHVHTEARCCHWVSLFHFPLVALSQAPFLNPGLPSWVKQLDIKLRDLLVSIPTSTPVLGLQVSNVTPGFYVGAKFRSSHSQSRHK